MYIKFQNETIIAFKIINCNYIRRKYYYLLRFMFYNSK